MAANRRLQASLPREYLMDMNTDPVFNTFVRVAEVWIPKDGRLVHAEGDYAHSQEFAEASVAESFAKGEGLPGKVWESEKPILLKEINGSYTWARSKSGNTGRNV